MPPDRGTWMEYICVIAIIWALYVIGEGLLWKDPWYPTRDAVGVYISIFGYIRYIYLFVQGKDIN